MFKKISVLVFVFLFVLPLLAQDDANTPEAAINAALTAVEAQVGSRAGSFTFQFLGESTDSSLGCALIQGEELPFPVEVILVTAIYPDAQYTVYTSISGQVVILCDAQFGEEVLANQIDSENACTVTPISALPAYAAPNINLDGVFTAGVEAYPVYGVSSDAGWYQIASDSGLGWIEATSVTVAGDCSRVPVTAVTNLDAEGVCFITAQGGFTNVRATPEGELTGRIYENEAYQITARNTAATWFFIQPAGWVSNTVIFQLGDCSNIPVNDNAIGIGFENVESLPIDTNPNVVLENLPCPADFAGYMPPRITTGDGTAQVETGNIPNTLRAFPSVDDAEAPRLGVIQPQRVIDRVISGPACNQGFVWWLVEIDGVIGWTAESNQSSNDYFLEPTGDAPVSTITIGDEIEVGTNQVDEFIYNSNGSRLFAHADEQGFGDGTVGVVIVFDATTGDSLARVEEPAGIVDIDYAVGTDDILIAAGNGTITVYNSQSFEQSAQLTGTFSIAEQARVEIMPDSSLILVASCTDDTCTASQITVFDVTGAEIASTTLDSTVIDMTISDDGSTLAVMTASGVSFHAPDTLEASSSWLNSDGFSLDSVAINQDGSSALIAGCNNADCTAGRIGLINTVDGTLLGIVPSHNVEATRVTYNNDDTRFVTVSETGEIIERSATTGEETQRFTITTVSVVSVTYTPDGSALAIGTSDGRVQFLALSNQ